MAVLGAAERLPVQKALPLDLVVAGPAEIEAGWAIPGWVAAGVAGPAGPVWCILPVMVPDDLIAPFGSGYVAGLDPTFDRPAMIGALAPLAVGLYSSLHQHQSTPRCPRLRPAQKASPAP